MHLAIVQKLALKYSKRVCKSFISHPWTNCETSSLNSSREVLHYDIKDMLEEAVCLECVHFINGILDGCCTLVSVIYCNNLMISRCFPAESVQSEINSATEKIEEPEQENDLWKSLKDLAG